MTNVLVVDDFATNGAMIKKILPSSEYQVKTVISGPQALNYLDSGKPVDIILLDLNMPEMDGIETLKSIRSREQFKVLPIIFVTGAADRERVMEGFKNGIDDIIAKPVEVDFLKDRMETALRGESPVQQYKKRNGVDDGIKSLYDELYGEFSKSITGIVEMGKDMLKQEVKKADSEISDTDEAEEDDEDEEETFGLDMNGILNENFW